jgi:hypothetical protein
LLASSDMVAKADDLQAAINWLMAARVVQATGFPPDWLKQTLT